MKKQRFGGKPPDRGLDVKVEASGPVAVCHVQGTDPRRRAQCLLKLESGRCSDSRRDDVPIDKAGAYGKFDQQFIRGNCQRTDDDLLHHIRDARELLFPQRRDVDDETSQVFFVWLHELANSARKRAANASIPCVD